MERKYLLLISGVLMLLGAILIYFSYSIQDESLQSLAFIFSLVIFCIGVFFGLTANLNTGE